MKLVQALFLVFVVVSVACSPSPTSVPTPTPTVPAMPTATVAATPDVPTPPNAVATPTSIGYVTSTPTPRARVVSIPEEASDHLVVKVEFPSWVEESPKMAQVIAGSDVIARAKFVSLESTTNRHDSYGYVVELLYKFEIVEYLKGSGENELVVRMDSGPKYIAFPDWLDHRSEEEAIELAQRWLNRSKSLLLRDKPYGIVLLDWSGYAKGHYFSSASDGQGRGGQPNVGETWLPEVKPLTYRHRFAPGESGTIPLSDLNSRIEDMRLLMEGDYASCVSMALYNRTMVRDQLLGIYRELTLGGYREPEPFPRYLVEIGSEESERVNVFSFRRPPYQSPRFSDYWLDGRDKDLFTIDVYDDATLFYERLSTVGALPQGEYSVHYNQFHSSLPCDEAVFVGYDDTWSSSDTAEWVITVTGP